jgi:hypothetical protein
MDSDTNDLPGDISRPDSQTGDPTANEGLVAYGLSAEVRRARERSFTDALEVAGPTFGEALRNLEALVARAEPFPLVGALATSRCRSDGAHPRFSRGAPSRPWQNAQFP